MYIFRMIKLKRLWCLIFLGQEDSSNAIESEGRFTGFNMKEELQEGHFDKQGTFIFDKDNVGI